MKELYETFQTIVVSAHYLEPEVNRLQTEKYVIYETTGTWNTGQIYDDVN